MTETYAVVPASVPFPSATTGLDALGGLIRGLSRTDVLFSCARLNLVLSNPRSAGVQQWAAARYMNAVEVRRLQAFAAAHGGTERIRVICRAQLLELFRWTCLLGVDRKDDGQTFETPTVRRRFARALLVAGDIWMSRTFAPGLGASSDMAMERRRAMSMFRNSIRSNEQATEIHRTFARALVMCDLGLRRHCANADADFRNAAGIDLMEYGALAGGLLIEFGQLTPQTSHTKTGLFRRNEVGAALTPLAREAMGHFMTLEGASPDTFRAAFMRADGTLPDAMDPFDLRPVWDHPILEVADGRAVVIDPHILSEKMVVGPAFYLAAHAKRGIQPLNALGHAFETYVTTILQRAKLSVIPNPMKPSPDGEIELADAIVVGSGGALVVEAKSAFLAEKVAVRKKYIELEGSKRATAKGVGQLARGIARIANDGFVKSPNDLCEVDELFPVLVVRDPTMASLGHLELLAEAFGLALAKHIPGISRTKVGRFALAPLTIMSVDDLETLAPSSPRLCLVGIVRSYCRQSYQNARPSLHDFMYENRARYKFSRGGFVADMGLEKMNEVARYLYGDAAPAGRHTDPP
jgi:hypothetical protein